MDGIAVLGIRQSSDGLNGLLLCVYKEVSEKTFLPRIVTIQIGISEHEHI